MKEVYKELIPIVLGDKSAGVYIAIMLFASLGALIRLLYTVIYRNKESEGTPKEFSFTFFLLDSSRRFALMIFCVYVFARFTNEMLGIFGWSEYSDYAATYYLYIFIGGAFDYLCHKKVPLILEKIVSKDKMGV